MSAQWQPGWPAGRCPLRPGPPRRCQRRCRSSAAACRAEEPGMLLRVAVLLGALAGGVAWLNVRGETPIPADARPSTGTAEQVARGAYLARVGNCMTCHT